MKILRFFPVLLIYLMACNSPAARQSETVSESITAAAIITSDNIEAYYFHFTARCITCRTIEESTKNNLQALYPEHTRTGLITFRSLNLDEDTCKIIADRLGVSGQTLLLVKGDQKINLTNEGFMYAVVKPEKFKEVINEKVEFLLSR